MLIDMDPQMGCGGMDWVDLTNDRDKWKELVDVVMNVQVP
jgi:hypothetical protein